MSTPSPTQPQGTLEEASSPKSRVRITVLTILALHVVVIGGLLLQGCDRPRSQGTPAASTPSSLPALNPDTNYFTSFPGDAASTNPGAPRSGTGAGASGLSGSSTTLGDAGSASIPPASASSAGSTPLPPVGSSGFAPLTGTPSGTAMSGQGTEHVIKKGDTIGALATKYHVTEKAILEANPAAKPKGLKVDDKLIIPAPAPAATASTTGTGTGTGDMASNTASATGGEVYVVKQGDNLAKIAKKFGVSVKAIRVANNIKGDRIVPKQKLSIPPKPAAAHAPPGGATVPAATARSAGHA